MRYDTGVARDDGRFDVNIIEPASRLAMVRLALGLYRGRFRASRYARCERADAVSMQPAESRPLELDGEIIEVTAARLDVLPKALRLCT
jgi:diacylglycerol kinase family enzyme